MTSEDNQEILLAVKWSLLVINAVSALYIVIIFFQYLASRNLSEGFSIIFMISCVIGFIVSFLGFDAALTADRQLLLAYGIIMLVNLVLASFGGHHVFAINLGLYVLCIILAFVYAYFIRHATELKVNPDTANPTF